MTNENGPRLSPAINGAEARLDLILHELIRIRELLEERNKPIVIEPQKSARRARTKTP